jgi:hypothetical protein
MPRARKQRRSVLSVIAGSSLLKEGMAARV